MAETPRNPDGRRAAKTRKIGRAVRSTQRAAKSSKKPDLDERNQRMVGPRKPMGPPLKDPGPSLQLTRSREIYVYADRSGYAARNSQRAADRKEDLNERKRHQRRHHQEEEALMAANDLSVFRTVGLPDPATSQDTSNHRRARGCGFRCAGIHERQLVCQPIGGWRCGVDACGSV